MKKILTNTYVFHGAEINGIEEGPNGVWGPKYTGEYREGFLIQAPGVYTKIVTFDVRDGEVYDESYRVDPNTVGMFIGTKDAYDAMIFSNSIVVMEIPNINSSGYRTAKGYVDFDDTQGIWIIKDFSYDNIYTIPLSTINITQSSVQVVGVYFKNDEGKIIEHVV